MTATTETAPGYKLLLVPDDRIEQTEADRASGQAWVAARHGVACFGPFKVIAHEGEDAEILPPVREPSPDISGDAGAALGDEWPLSPRTRQCAAHLACKFHDTRERIRVGDAHAQERYDWNELPDRERELLVETFYSLVHQGVIFCPAPAHYIGTGARFLTSQGTP